MRAVAVFMGSFDVLLTPLMNMPVLENTIDVACLVSLLNENTVYIYTYKYLVMCFSFLFLVLVSCLNLHRRQIK